MTVHCRAIHNGVRYCDKVAAYRATFTDCPVCAREGFLTCFGHSVCADDAADLRADQFVFVLDGASAVVSNLRMAV
ncbi:hypothetical protein Ssi03_50930 [Sphaerisporangium siamense]|uniref:Uncharacterized protein n=1 Tax=Sphaerisporangium siamense TaxID=795645 RepID=A0A7W7G8W4_9ACTN|nr:hypothetical protein [Sphaerisporangium siamense]MBB4702203.1 hypothetical protein [Sphaerisporangium siamense]GII87103.1 hypothetical protein Ssi03_50930 [Sphaerisporangium siamense]